MDNLDTFVFRTAMAIMLFPYAVKGYIWLLLLLEGPQDPNNPLYQLMLLL